MHRIGVDVGSSYTKYCIIGEGEEGILLDQERTPLMQRSYFAAKLEELKEIYGDISVVSCGYGKKNVAGIKVVNELIALVRGCSQASPESHVILDIGGQDTKVIRQEGGRLKDFFVNDRCAAGSGMFLYNTCQMLEVPFNKIDLKGVGEPSVKLSSICAVFSQTEIVGLVAENTSIGDILRAVIWQILVQSKSLLEKIGGSRVLLSGGLTQIPGFQEYAQLALERECHTVDHGNYLSAMGCALLAIE